MAETQRPEELAERVRHAVDSADAAAMADLLHPNAKWGAPDDPKPSCQNRRQVLDWYQQSRERGVGARVTEVEVRGDKILVGMKVAGRSPDGEPGAEVDRWQVMTVVDGQIADIRGFEGRDEAAVRAGVQDH